MLVDDGSLGLGLGMGWVWMINERALGAFWID